MYGPKFRCLYPPPPPKDHVCSFGVLLDCDLSLESQVTSVARSAYALLMLFCQLWLFLASAVPPLVTFHLNYCNALSLGLLLKTGDWRLQLVQNVAFRLVSRAV